MSVCSSSRTALNRYGNSSLLTTNPGTSGTSTGVFSNASHSARARARACPRSRALGKISSTSCIRVTGLNTCSPTNRSGRPLSAARRSIDSEEVVLARIASAPSMRSSSASRPALTSWSSTTASTTKVLSARARGSVTIWTCSGSTSAPRRPRVFSTVARARSAESSRAGEQQHRAVMGRGSGEAAGDRAAADYRETFVHCASLSPALSLPISLFSAGVSSTDRLGFSSSLTDWSI